MENEILVPLSPKIKFEIVKENKVVDTIFLEADLETVTLSILCNQLASISLNEESKDELVEKKYEHLSDILQVKLHDNIRPILIEKGLLQKGSIRDNCDINIDELNLDKEDCFNSVIVFLQVLIF